MKKTSTIVRGKDAYEMSILINNIALVKSKDGTSGLLNIKTNKLIGPMRKYYTIYDENKKFYTQTWSDDSEEMTNARKVTSYIRVYDAKNEEMLVEDSELVESHRSHHEVFTGRTSDGKIHLFDKFNCRNSGNINNLDLDGVEKLLDRYNDSYYLLRKNGKCALYFSNCFDKTPKLMTDFVYDNIEAKHNVIIFTRNGKKHFIFYDDENGKSIDFDDIEIEEENRNILYGKKGNKIFVYNTYSKDLILEIEADSLKYIKKDGDSANEFYGEFFFIFERDKKQGLVSSNVYLDKERKRAISTHVIAKNIYDEIEYGKYSGAFYTKKNNRCGLIVGSGSSNQIIEPAYDDITNLKNDFFVFMNNGTKKIQRVIYHKTYDPIIEGNIEYESVNDGYIITKNNKQGMIITGSNLQERLIEPKYDEIKEEATHYYIAKRDNKKGVINRGRVIIPVEYDEITLGGEYPDYSSIKDAKKIYFALRKGKDYELAKIDNYNYNDRDVEFVSNHRFKSIEFYKNLMVFRDEQYTYIYNYEEKLLKTLPSNADFREVKKKESSYSFKYLYYIDGKYYYYRDGKLTEEHVEERDFFVTTYEGDNDVYEISTPSQDEHDAFCEMIDKLSDEEAEKELEDLSKNKQKVKSMYPSITLTKRNKEED